MINTVLAGYGVRPLATLGELFAGRTMLLTYPELDIYPERGPSDYYGITDSGEGKAVTAEAMSVSRLLSQADIARRSPPWSSASERRWADPGLRGTIANLVAERP